MDENPIVGFAISRVKGACHTLQILGCHDETKPVGGSGGAGDWGLGVPLRPEVAGFAMRSGAPIEFSLSR